MVIVVINIICAAILIAYVAYKSHKKAAAKKEKALKEAENIVQH